MTMQMAIRRLPPDAIAQIRTGVSAPSLAQCAEELVANAVDAGATSVRLTVDLQRFGLCCADNGGGISRADLELVGRRYHTSKLCSIGQLNGVASYGFRGEALASLVAIAELVQITTRRRRGAGADAGADATGSSLTYLKRFAPPLSADAHGDDAGGAAEITPAAAQRVQPGTTVSVAGIYGRCPVRQRTISSADLDQVRGRVETLALAHPAVSFAVVRAEDRVAVLQTTRADDSAAVFAQLYGADKAGDLIPVHGAVGGFECDGFVSSGTHHTKKLQYLYVDGRHVLRTRIHTELNKYFAALAAPTARFGSPPARGSRFGVFILNLRCPAKAYDVCFEPAKTVVEFRDWDQALACIDKAVRAALDPAPAPPVDAGGSAVSTPARSPPSTTPQAAPAKHVHPLASSHAVQHYSPRAPLAAPRQRTPDGSKRAAPSALSRFHYEAPQNGVLEVRVTRRRVRTPSAASGDSGGQAPGTPALTAATQAPSRTPRVPQSGRLTLPSPAVLRGAQTVPVSNDGGAATAAEADDDTLNAAMTILEACSAARSADTDGPPIDDAAEPLEDAAAAHGARTPETTSPDRGVKWRSGFPPAATQAAGEPGQPENAGWAASAAYMTAAAAMEAPYGPGVLRPGAIRPERLTKAMLSQLEVVNQVDCKFIVCTLRPEEPGAGRDAEPHSGLFIVDQHAAHERVRLEQLTTELCTVQLPNPTNSANSTHSTHSTRSHSTHFAHTDSGGSADPARPNAVVSAAPRQRTVRAVGMLPPVTLDLGWRDVQLAERFRDQLADLGVELMLAPASFTRGAQPSRAHIIPAALRRSTPGTIVRYVHEQLAVLEATGGASIAHGVIPSVIKEVLDSRACHGAIKFGDPLTKTECVALVHALADCQLPFQCAHGRPTVLPIACYDSLGGPKAPPLAR